jgi:hypothetical protein
MAAVSGDLSVTASQAALVAGLYVTVSVTGKIRDEISVTAETAWLLACDVVTLISGGGDR